VALVRVYCGLAAADVASWLTVAVVDDAGRLLEVRDISDDPAGYAHLGAMLADRSTGGVAVPVAADRPSHLVTQLLVAANRPLAIADDDLTEDFAERFADDDSLEEMQSPAAERRAIGLARALQAGAVSVVAHQPSRELDALKPVLAAHAAITSGRHTAAVSLREVLRELYPAALRAYPDPAEQIPLAVLERVPEPSMLTNSAASRNRDGAIIAELTATGLADTSNVAAAVTALRVAIAESPRRGSGRVLAPAVAETVRQAVAAVRAFDAGAAALVAALVQRLGATVAAVPAPRARLAPVPEEADSRAEPARVPAPRRRGRAESGVPAAAGQPEYSGQPDLAGHGRAEVPGRDRVDAGGHRRSDGGHRRAADVPAPAVRPDLPAAAVRPPMPPVSPAAPPMQGQPLSPAMPPMQGQPSMPAASYGSPDLLPPLIEPAPWVDPDLVTPGPAPTPSRPPVGPSPGVPAPGSRSNWPLIGADDDRAVVAAGYGPRADADTGSHVSLTFSADGYDAPTSGAGSRVPPPWLAEDMPAEPPMLRLVDNAARNGGPAPADPLTAPMTADSTGELHFTTTPHLRVVGGEAERRNGRSRRAAERPAPANASVNVSEQDGDLLIFSQTRSAWFTHLDASEEVEREPTMWSSLADEGWRAAEQAARPAVGAETMAGLPRRVPQANLVPGTAPSAPRPLRIIRDAASIAAHTTGYFRGWRRGQEIGGFAVGQRDRGAWEFNRDQRGRDMDRDAAEHRTRRP
jgi:hypothetical protein